MRLENLNVDAQFAIVCDSGSDLPDSFYSKYQVALVPFHVRLGSEDLLDIQDAVPEDFYVRFSSQRERATTSYPSPAEYGEAYAALIERGVTHIISLHVSNEISGSYAAAMSAASDFEDDEVVIEVIDTRTASAAYGFILADLVAMRDGGVSFDEAIAHINVESSLSQVYFVPTRKNALAHKKADKRGLLSRFHKVMDAAFGTRFLEHIDEEGRIQTVAASADLSDAAGRIARLMSRDSKIQGDLTYVEINVGVPRDLALLEKPLDTNEFVSFKAGITNAGPALACHVGVGSVGLAYIPSSILFDKQFAGRDAWVPEK